MSLSQRDYLLYLFRINGYRISLKTILETTLAAEYRARMSELRRDGYTITCKKGKTAAENTYTLMEPFQVEPTGQLRFA